MSEKEIVREFLNEGEDEIVENDVFVELMLPLAKLTEVVQRGEIPSKELLANTRKSIEFFQGYFDDINRVIDLYSDLIEEEEA